MTSAGSIVCVRSEVETDRFGFGSRKGNRKTCRFDFLTVSAGHSASSNQPTVSYPPEMLNTNTNDHSPVCDASATVQAFEDKNEPSKKNMCSRSNNLMLLSFSSTCQESPNAVSIPAPIKFPGNRKTNQQRNQSIDENLAYREQLSGIIMACRRATGREIVLFESAKWNHEIAPQSK
jgi:hypothetical protein